MPIHRVNPLQQARFPSGVERLSQHTRNLLLYGDTLDRTLDPEQGDPATWGEAWRAQVGVGLMQSMVSSVTRLGAVGADDPDFNPYEHIKATPALANSPMIQFMVERGQFDQSHSQRQFDFDYLDGLRFMEDLDRLQRTSWTQYGVTMAGTMIGDPTNLIPAGVGVSALKKLSTSARIAAIAGGIGAFSLGAEKLQNQLQPVSNEPGLSNEIMAFAAGAGMGAGLGLLTSPAVRGGVAGALSHRKLKQLRRDFDRMMVEPVVSRASRTFTREGDQVTQMASAQPNPNVPAEQRLSKVAIQDEIAAGEQVIRQALDELPVDNRVVVALRRKGDTNDQLITELRQKYADAGKSLHVVDHPDQWFYDLTSDIDQIMAHPGMTVEAGPGDFDYGWLDAAVTHVSTRYANAQAVVTPGGRLAQTTLGRLNDVYRTLSGSAQTITTGSARNPFDFQTGAPAENIKGIYEASKDRAVLDLRLSYNNARRSDKPITYNGQEIPGRFAYGKFRQAVADLLRREHARHRGFTVPLPEDVHPAIREAADASRAYFRRMRDELETTGMLEVGPQALARAQDEVAQLEKQVQQVRRKMQAAEQLDEAERGALFEQGNFTQGDLRARLRAYRDELAGGGDSRPSFEIAQDIINAKVATGELNVDTFTVRPDDIEHLTPQQKARVRRFAHVSDDGADVQEAIGDRLYQQVIDELAEGGRDNSMRAMIDGILRNPEQHDPERVLDAYLFDRWQDMDAAERAVPRSLVNPADLPDGTAVRIHGHDWTVTTEAGERVIRDGMEFGVDEVSMMPVDTASLDGLDVPTMPERRVMQTRAARYRARLQRLEAKANRRRDSVAKLQRAVNDQDFYLPRVFDTQKILGNEADFIDRLARSFRQSDAIVDGRRVTDYQRPVLAEVAEKLDRQQLEAARIALDEKNGKVVDDVPDFLADLPDEPRAPVTPPQRRDPRDFRIPFRESSKPRLGRSELVFESDLDKAAYIIRHSAGRRSKRDGDFLRAVMEFTGLDEAAARRLGDNVKEAIQRQGIRQNGGTYTVRAGASKFTPGDAPATATAVADPPTASSPDQPFRTLDELIDGMVEGDLPDELQTAYRAQLEAYYDRNARAAFEKLTHPNERHGVVDGLASDPIKRRIMDVDEADLADYIEQDLELVMERYHRVVGGRAATRRSIQLNPQIWNGVVLKDGTKVETGEHLVQYLEETLNTLERWAAFTDRQKGVQDARFGRMLPGIQALKRRMRKDIAYPLATLEGRNPISQANGVYAGLASMGRSLGRLTYLNKLGSVFWAQLNDLAPITMHMMQRPQTLAMLPRAMGHLKKLPRRDLEVMGLMFDSVSRSRAIADVDYLSTGLGFGEGMVREASARVETGLGRAGDFQARVSLMNWITDVSKRTAGAMVLDRVTDQSKRMVRAADLLEKGGDDAASVAMRKKLREVLSSATDVKINAPTDVTDALRRVGLNRYDASRLNHMGLNLERARQYHKLVYQHGLTLDDEPIRAAMSFDDYMKSKAVVKPNFADWPAADRRVKDLLDTLTANINGEVNRSMIVTPGAFDRPLVNFNTLGRLFNQFQTFGMAFVNQRLRVMAQMPAKYQLWYVMSYLFLGSLSDGIANHLSGRRTLDETATLWKDNPLGMTYASFERSGLSGWLGRPIAIADAMGIPFSPGNLFDNTIGSSASRHVQPGKVLTYAGPAAADIDRLLNVGADMLAGDADESTAYNAWKLMPAQNLLWWRMLQQTTDLPVTPEKLIEDRFKDEAPTP